MFVLSEKQYKALTELIKVTIEDVIEKTELVTKSNLRYFPTKTDIDKLSGEIKDLREEVTVHNAQVSRNFDRIEKLENIHPSYIHQ